MNLSKEFEENRVNSSAAEIGRKLLLGEFPDVTFRLSWTNPEGGNLKIGLNQEIEFEVTAEIGGDAVKKDLQQRVSNIEIEEKILEAFPNKMIAKILFDHVFACMEKDAGKENVKLYRYGNTDFCQGSSG